MITATGGSSRSSMAWAMLTASSHARSATRRPSWRRWVDLSGIGKPLLSVMRLPGALQRPRKQPSRLDGWGLLAGCGGLALGGGGRPAASPAGGLARGGGGPLGGPWRAAARPCRGAGGVGGSSMGLVAGGLRVRRVVGRGRGGVAAGLVAGQGDLPVLDEPLELVADRGAGAADPVGDVDQRQVLAGAAGQVAA